MIKTSRPTAILLLLLAFWMLPLQALVLEEIDLRITLQNRRVGYFVGSFDPFHKAHEAIAETALSLDLCDYVLIHPVWGGDIYKVRSDISIRLEMLFALYEHHPHVIVSKYNPKELQNALVDIECNYIGVIGSDTALYLSKSPETSLVYMTGKKIPEEYETHTWGSCMALKADVFIMALRQNDDISSLNGFLRERPIIQTFEIGSKNSLSSTFLKANLDSISEIVSPPVEKVIRKHGLFK